MMNRDAQDIDFGTNTIVELLTSLLRRLGEILKVDVIAIERLDSPLRIGWRFTTRELT